MKRQAVASPTMVEASIDFIARNKSARTTLFGIFQEPQSTSMKSVTLSKSPFPTDFSLVCITGFELGTNPEALANMLRGFGFELTTNCVSIPKLMVSSEPKATVKVEDPLFARELSSRLSNGRSSLRASPIPINAQQTSCRKFYMSWYKSTRSV